MLTDITDRTRQRIDKECLVSGSQRDISALRLLIIKSREGRHKVQGGSLATATELTIKHTQIMYRWKQNLAAGFCISRRFPPAMLAATIASRRVGLPSVSRGHRCLHIYRWLRDLWALTEGLPRVNHSAQWVTQCVWQIPLRNWRDLPTNQPFCFRHKIHTKYWEPSQTGYSTNNETWHRVDNHCPAILLQFQKSLQSDSYLIS